MCYSQVVKASVLKLILLFNDVIFLTIPRDCYSYECTTDFVSPGDYFFSRAKHIMGHFAGFFEGAETFLTPLLSVAKNIMSRLILNRPQIRYV